MKGIKVGYLPLYLKLYDDALGSMRARIDDFNSMMQQTIEEKGIELVSAPVCRTREEFEKAVPLFDDVCAVITLHLAYSPSLESIDALVKINKPIIVLDTTPSYSFDPTLDSEEILYNHGIHGVQDMCNMLKRRGVQYYVAAGHWENSDVVDKSVELCRAAYVARLMKNARVGRIGSSFKGMGDFFVTPEELEESIGSTVIPFDINRVEILKSEIIDEEVGKEMDADLKLFETVDYDDRAHRRTARMNLMVRQWIERNELDAYTMNFSDFDRKYGFECVPFVEACKSMARGIGYAGEGDVLTAALCGALLKIYPETSFTEMFCPDWKGNSLFLSHMGEMNVKTARGKMQLTVKEYPYSDVDAPLMVNGCFKPGDAVLINLAPMGDGQYTLILSKVSVLPTEGDYSMKDSIHGWIKPEKPVADFLEQYSTAGGTHHLVMVYGDALSCLSAFGKMMGFSVEII